MTHMRPSEMAARFCAGSGQPGLVDPDHRALRHCPVCHRLLSVKSDGRVWRHKGLVTPPMTAGRRVLETPMDPASNGAHASSVKGYLGKLLETLWIEEEGFSGKRPFGNSGWEDEVYQAMLAAGLIIALDDEDADALVLAAIAEMSL